MEKGQLRISKQAIDYAQILLGKHFALREHSLPVAVEQGSGEKALEGCKIKFDFVTYI